MNTSKKSSPKALGQGDSSWRSSLYEEPVWISVAWVVGPVALAALAILFALK